MSKLQSTKNTQDYNSLEALYTSDPSSFETTLATILQQVFRAGTKQDNEESKKANLTIELLLSSQNKELVESTKKITTSFLESDKLTDQTLRGYPYGITALAEAAEAGHANLVRLLLESDKITTDIVHTTSLLIGSETALSKAAKAGHTNVVKLLLESGKVTTTERHHKAYVINALHTAIRAGQDDVVRVFLESDKITPEIVNGKNDSGSTALYVAAATGETAIARLLLNSDKTDPKTLHEKSSNDNTPLLAAIIGSKKEMVGLLLDHMTSKEINGYLNQLETNLKVFFKEGFASCQDLIDTRLKKSPYDHLLEGISEGDIRKVEIAIKDGAKVNQQDTTSVGNTPLMILANISKGGSHDSSIGTDKSTIKIAQLLMEHGADIMVENKRKHKDRNQTVLDLVEPGSGLEKLFKHQLEFEGRFHEELGKLSGKSQYLLQSAIDAMTQTFKPHYQLDETKLSTALNEAANKQRKGKGVMGTLRGKSSTAPVYLHHFTKERTQESRL